MLRGYNRCLQTFNSDALLELIKALVRLDKHWIPQEPGHSLYVRPTLSEPVFPKCYSAYTNNFLQLEPRRQLVSVLQMKHYYLLSAVRSGRTIQTDSNRLHYMVQRSTSVRHLGVRCLFAVFSIT